MGDEYTEANIRIMPPMLFGEDGCGENCWEYLKQKYPGGTRFSFFNKIAIDSGFDMTLEQVISKLGNPAFVLFDFDVDGWTDEFDRLSTIYYPKFGYTIRLIHPTDTQTAEQWKQEPSVEVCLFPDLRVRSLHIQQPCTIEELLSNHKELGSSAGKYYFKLLESWNGYTCKTVDMPCPLKVMGMMQAESQDKPLKTND